MRKMDVETPDMVQRSQTLTEAQQLQQPSPHIDFELTPEFRPRAASEKLPRTNRSRKHAWNTTAHGHDTDMPTGSRRKFSSEKYLQFQYNYPSNCPFTDCGGNSLVDPRPTASVKKHSRKRHHDSKYHRALSQSHSKRSLDRDCASLKSWARRAGSDTHLYKHKLSDSKFLVWQSAEDSAALLACTTPSSSSAEDEASDYNIGSLNDTRSQDRVAPCEQRTEHNNNTIAGDATNHATSGELNCSTTNGQSGDGDIHHRSRQQHDTAAQGQMDYLTVPTRWKTHGSTANITSSPGNASHHCKQGHSKHRPDHHHHHPLQQQPQQHSRRAEHQDEPLLRHPHHEDFRERKKHRHRYLITGKAGIWLFTRIVFLMLMLLGMGVILTSLWLMLECKHRFQAVRPLLPNTATFCNTMGMPALFAACTVLFTICGLACTGRKFTGYALIVISGVEILQSVTTVTFYKCRVLSAGRVLASVNESLLECHAAVQLESSQAFLGQLRLGGGSSRPGQHGSDGFDKGFSKLPFSVAPTKYGMASPATTPPPHAPRVDRPGGGKQQRGSDVIRSTIITLQIDNNAGEEAAGGLARIKRNVGKVDHKHVKPLLSRDAPNRFIGATDPRIQRSLERYEDAVEGREHAPLAAPQVKASAPQVDCSADSRFFQILSDSADRATIAKCRKVCRTYQDVCETAWEDYSEDDDYTSSDYKDVWGRVANRELRRSEKSPNVNTDLRAKRSSRDFQWAVQQCGRRVERRVHNLCYYDNQIILPMSMCAPVAYILFSCCFIYLARCEVALTEKEGCKIVTSASSSSSTTNTTTIVLSSTGRSSRAGSTASFSTEASAELQQRALSKLRRCCVRAPWSRRPSVTRRSQSSHELLRLQTVMYSISTIVGLTMLETDVAAEAV